MNILVTGAAGFIGMLVAIVASPGADRFRFVHAPLEDMPQLDSLFTAECFDGVVHLAPQTGGPVSPVAA